MKDSRIIQLFCKRSERAVTELNKKYNRYMNRISYNILSNPEDVEECVNDTCLKIWQSIPPTIPKSLKAYIGRIIRNLSLDRLRKSNTDKRGSGEIEVVFDELEEVIGGYNTVEDTVLTRELMKEINVFLGSLSKEKRVIFVARYFYAENVKNISLNLNISESKVKTTLHRLRADLKEYLKSRGVEIWEKENWSLEN